MSAEERTTRRDLLLAAARATCIAGLAAGAALLAWRNGRAPCGKRSACGGCRLRSRCDVASGSEQRRK